MPTAPDRDEQDAEDPFADFVRADHGYRIGIRIERRRDRRLQIVTAVTAFLIVGGIAVAALRIHLPESATKPTPGALASARPAVAVPTRLPTMSRPVSLAQPIAPFPVMSGELRWLDPTQGQVSGPPPSGARGWIFPGSDGGAWCVCYDAPSSDAGTVERTTVVRYDPAGAQVARTTVGEFDTTDLSGGAIQRDVTRSPDGADLYLAAMVRDLTGWSMQLQRISLTGTPALRASIDLGRIGRYPGRTIGFAPVVRVSPDGLRVRVTARYADFAQTYNGPVTQERTWLVSTASGDLGAAGLGGVLELTPRPLAGANCPAEAWVSPTVYASFCTETTPEGLVPVAHLEMLDGRESNVQVGDPIGSDDLDWLVDGGAGIIYRWSRFGHFVARLDVATGEVKERGLGLNLAELGAEQARPGPRPGRTVWERLVAAEDAPPARLAGSIDGSLLYAIGARTDSGHGASGPLFASTGIWVFDATTLAVVAHWPAAAMYDQVGVSPDGRFVLAVGLEGMTADGALAEWQPSLAFHDPGDGALVEQIARLAGDDGPFVDLLPPGPVP